MAKKKPEEPPKGSPAWMNTFSDLMTLLLCFFVLLFSMSEIDAEKFEQLAQSLASSYSILDGGAEAIGDGKLISNGVSQLNDLAEYYNTMGQLAEEIEDAEEESLEKKGFKESEEMSEQIEEMLANANIADEVDMDFTAQYVSLTLNGSLLFDSGSAELKKEVKPIIKKVGVILTRYKDNIIEIEGHTDNVPMANKNFGSNDELSSFRALSVFQYLMETTDLDPAKIKHSGRGEYIPIADNSTAEGRARNRRVEIKIYNDLSSY